MSDAPMIVHLYDDRRMVFSPWSIGNSKIGSGPGVYTYSRAPGRAMGTCPGSTPWCEANCYAKRVEGPVFDVWVKNSRTDKLPPPPDDARLIRIHVSGDFDTQDYVHAWVDLALERPEVSFFGYTRSWRVAELYGWLLVLRDMHNVQLFASVDPGDRMGDENMLLDQGWRLSRIDETGDMGGFHCPEQTGRKDSCDECRYCIDDHRWDVVFSAH